MQCSVDTFKTAAEDGVLTVRIGDDAAKAQLPEPAVPVELTVL